MNDNTAASNTADGTDTADLVNNTAEGTDTADAANQQPNAPARVLLNKIRVESSFSYNQSDR